MIGNNHTVPESLSAQWVFHNIHCYQFSRAANDDWLRWSPSSRKCVFSSSGMASSSCIIPLCSETSAARQSSPWPKQKSWQFSKWPRSSSHVWRTLDVDFGEQLFVLSHDSRRYCAQGYNPPPHSGLDTSKGCIWESVGKMPCCWPSTTAGVRLLQNETNCFVRGFTRNNETSLSIREFQSHWRAHNLFITCSKHSHIEIDVHTNFDLLRKW